MSARASKLIAISWLKTRRPTFLLVLLTAALAIALGALVAGTLDGTTGEMEQRIKDTWTADGRSYAPASNVIESRYESQYILTRGTFFGKYISENEQFEVSTGASNASSNAFTFGVLAGLGGENETRITSYVVAGNFPGHTQGRMEIMLGQTQAATFARGTPGEMLGQLQAMDFEITNGNVVETPAGKDVRRAPVAIVGIFATKIPVIDSNVIFANASAVAQLDGVDEGSRNMFLNSGPGATGVTANEFAAQFLGAWWQAFIALARGSVLLVIAIAAGWIGQSIGRSFAADQASFAVANQIGLPTHAIITAKFLVAAIAWSAGIGTGVLAALAAGPIIAAQLAQAGALPIVFVVPWQFIGLAAVLGLAISGIGLIKRPVKP